MTDRRRFQFRVALSLCVAVALAILLSLGGWQLKRLAWKQALIAQVEARVGAAPIALEEALRAAEAAAAEYIPVALDGVWLERGAAKLFGSYQGAAGYYLFAPMKSEDAGIIYVNLGFTPQQVDAELPTGAARITGLFRAREVPQPPAAWFQPTGQGTDGYWYIRDPLAFAEAAGIEAAPYYIDSFARPGADWPKGGTTRLTFTNNHLQYAMTWFGLAATLIGVWFVYSFRAKDQHRD